MITFCPVIEKKKKENSPLIQMGNLWANNSGDLNNSETGAKKKKVNRLAEHQEKH